MPLVGQHFGPSCNGHAAGRRAAPVRPLNPHLHWQTGDGGGVVRLYCGDAAEVLRTLPSRWVQAVVTSPPYWLQRTYLDPEHADSGREIGNEHSVEAYVGALTAVFAECRRVLRDDGVLWVNLAGSYVGGRMDLVPHRFVLAMEADGWVPRSDVIWWKPNALPEQAYNRPARSHEHLLMLTKGDGYYYDAEAVKEVSASEPHAPGNRKADRDGIAVCRNRKTPEEMGQVWAKDGRTNRRDVWRIPAESYAGQHTAPYPVALVEPCVLASTSGYGCCAECGTPDCRSDGADPDHTTPYAPYFSPTQVLWEKRCRCNTDEVEACRVLDPFAGTGTTLLCCIQQGRSGVGIELSRETLEACTVPRVRGGLLEYGMGGLLLV
jgi:DNA modification methylase